MKAVWPVVVLGLATANIAAADSSDPQQGLAWLSRMAAASNQLNYSGTFVYQPQNIGDGKVWVSPVDTVVRVRTGERGADAL